MSEIPLVVITMEGSSSTPPADEIQVTSSPGPLVPTDWGLLWVNTACGLSLTMLGDYGGLWGTIGIV